MNKKVTFLFYFASLFGSGGCGAPSGANSDVEVHRQALVLPSPFWLITDRRQNVTPFPVDWRTQGLLEGEYNSEIVPLYPGDQEDGSWVLCTSDNRCLTRTMPSGGFPHMPRAVLQPLEYDYERGAYISEQRFYILDQWDSTYRLRSVLGGDLTVSDWENSLVFDWDPGLFNPVSNGLFRFGD